MKIEPTALPEVLEVSPDVFGDERGHFLECWNDARYRSMGFPDVSFVQTNHSRSAENVVRGLHYQVHQPQGKLIFVANGAILDVAVDLRQGSANFGKWVSVELTDENHKLLYVPPGFAHGFRSLRESTDVIYMCTTHYDPASDTGVLWDDQDIAVEWGIRSPLLSAKDAKLPPLKVAMNDGNLPDCGP